MKIAVAGGTGVVGRHAVEAIRASGHEAVVLARSKGIDLLSGVGLADALAGADAVIDVVSVQTMSADAARTFFETTTKNLLAAEAEAGVAHHVALSIIGVDKAPYSYYAGKLAQENAVLAGDVPWTILRATQFHEFAAQMYERMVHGPFGLIPGMRTQPIAAREVAEHLLALAVAAPVGRTPDLGGPREERLIEMVRRFAKKQGRSGRLIELAVPGAYGRAMRDGTLLPSPSAHHGKQGFAEWLRELPDNELNGHK